MVEKKRQLEVEERKEKRIDVSGSSSRSDSKRSGGKYEAMWNKNSFINVGELLIVARTTRHSIQLILHTHCGWTRIDFVRPIKLEKQRKKWRRRKKNAHIIAGNERLLGNYIKIIDQLRWCYVRCGASVFVCSFLLSWHQLFKLH